MSFFPRPVASTERATTDDCSSTCRTYCAASSSAHDAADAYGSGGEWTSTHGFTDAAFTSTPATSWTPEHAGHGAHLFHAPGAHAFVAVDASGMRGQWRSAYAQHAFPSGSCAAMVRKDSTLDCCDPLSTLLPSSSGWESMQSTDTTVMPTHETSPGRSEYSTSSRASGVTSSPYAVSDRAFQPDHSPYIKIEEPWDGPYPLVHAGSGATPYQSMLINPVNVYTSPSMSAVDGKTYEVSIPVGKLESQDAGDGGYREHSSHPRSESQEKAHAKLMADRRKRGYTTPLNSTCACDTCGKLFQRSYNLKAHLETHEPDRDHPHVCSYAACRRRFARRTDLSRHEQSVHVKARNHHCPLCESSFSRKDTLRRHVDDGCLKRVEVRKGSVKPRRNSSRTRDR